VGLLAFCLYAVPSAAAQQPVKVWRIGVVTSSAPPGPLWLAFQEALRDLGYTEGKNIVLNYQVRRLGDDGHAAARELVAEGVDVIVVGGANAQVLAAKAATTTVPIVMIGAFQVVETGLVVSLTRPGTNVTGMTWDTTMEEAGKRLELFKRLVPNVSRLSNLWDSSQPGMAAYWPVVRRSAEPLGIRVDSVPVTDTASLEDGLAKLTKNLPSALFVWGGPVNLVHRQRICEWALNARLPTLAQAEQYAEAGCLMSYAPNLTQLFREAAGYVDKILRGAKPSDLPVAQPSKFSFVLNAKTARTLGLTIPASLLLSADQVIE